MALKKCYQGTGTFIRQKVDAHSIGMACQLFTRHFEMFGHTFESSNVYNSLGTPLFKYNNKYILKYNKSRLEQTDMCPELDHSHSFSQSANALGAQHFGIG